MVSNGVPQAGGTGGGGGGLCHQQESLGALGTWLHHQEHFIAVSYKREITQPQPRPCPCYVFMGCMVVMGGE